MSRIVWVKDYFLVRPTAHLLWILNGRRADRDLDDWQRAKDIVNCLLAIGLLGGGTTALSLFGMRYLLIVVVLIAAIFFNKRKHITDIFLIFALIILIGINSTVLKNEFSAWHQLAKDKFEYLKEAKVSKDGISGAFDLPTKTTSEKPTPNIQPDLRHLTGNIIQNGDFQSWLVGKPLGWGHGLYSDRFKAAYGSTLFWINFLNANIQASIDKTEKGSALKIAHLSETQDHSVGVMEQYVDAAPGIYRLTFWAKAEADFERGGLQFFVTDDWRITDKINPEIKRGFEIEKEGPFEWQQLFGELQIDSPGRRTFFVVSAKKGTVWVADISLIKIRDLET